MPAGPRVLGAKDVAATAAGQKLQGDELQKTAKKAKGALLAVAILQTLGIGLVFFLLNNANSRGVSLSALPGMMQVLIAVQAGVAAIFWGLWFWARVSPLPAAIVGLVLYGTLVVLSVVNSVSQMNQGGQGSGFGGIGIGWIDIIIIGVLIQAIQAGAKHRKLMQQQAAGM